MKNVRGVRTVRVATSILALAAALFASASTASAQCNPVLRVSEAHVDPARGVPREGNIDLIMQRLREEPELYDILGCPVDFFGQARDGWTFLNFEHGALYTLPYNWPTEIHGAIYDKWSKLQWEWGPLGFPWADERAGPGGSRYSDFEHGMVVWHPGNGAFAVYGEIKRQWESDHGIFPHNADPWLPVSDEFTSRGGKNSCPANHRQQVFRPVNDRHLRGVACWDANTGRVTFFTYPANTAST